MRTLIALTLLLAEATASGSKESGYKQDSYFSAYDLQQAEDYLHRVANEKAFVRKQADMVKAQKGELLQKLQEIRFVKVPQAEEEQRQQNDHLDRIRRDLKVVLHRAGDIEAQLAGEVAVAKCNEAKVSPLSARINELVHSNNVQDGLIQKSITSLINAYEKAVEKLNATRNSANDRVEELQDNTKAYADLVNTRHCTWLYMRVEINKTTNFGEVYENYALDFGSNTPTVYCTLQGFESKVNLDQSQAARGYDGYDYAERRENLALSVDCKAFEDEVLVQAFDQSIGKGNRALAAYVLVKACSFGAQAGVRWH